MSSLCGHGAALFPAHAALRHRAHGHRHLSILYDNPREVGADRIVNCVAAFHKYGGPCIVVDLGTAITFDAISAHAEYLGGIICPGIGISISGLFTKTARLPMVDFREPDKVDRHQHRRQHAAPACTTAPSG